MLQAWLNVTIQYVPTDLLKFINYIIEWNEYTHVEPTVFMFDDYIFVFVVRTF
jgi:hypothetical protein